MSIIMNEKLESAFHNYLNQLERDGSCLDDGWEGHQESFKAGYEAAMKEQESRRTKAEVELRESIERLKQYGASIKAREQGLSCE